MSHDCDATLPLLADFLTGALDATQQAQIEGHLPECPACSEELSALLELSEQLGELAPAAAQSDAPDTPPQLKLHGAGADRPRVHDGGGWRWVAVLSAAALLLAASVLWRQPAARVVVAGAEVRRLVPGESLVATGPSRLLLPCGSEVEVETGATLRLLGRRELALDTGVGWFRVAKAEEPFLVRARGTRVRVLGTSFRVEVKEIDMNPKQGAALGAAVFVAVATGVVLFETDQGSEELRAGQGARATTAGVITRLTTDEDVAKRLLPLEQAKAELEAENLELRQRQQALQAQVAKLETQLASRDLSSPEGSDTQTPDTQTPEPKTTPVEAKPKSQGLRIRVSGVEQNEALATVNWSRAGEGAVEIVPHLEAVWEAIQGGKPIDPEVQKTIYKANQKLVEVILEIQGKVPTHTAGNGEFTHPLVLVNLMAEHLKRAGEPFQADQITSLSRVGDDYQIAWDLAQSRYGKATPRLRKLADELRLKRDAMAKVEGVLTAAQRAVVIFDKIRHINQLDIYSPIMAVIMNAKPLGVTEQAPLRESLERVVASQWTLNAADLAAAGPTLDAWARALEPHLVTCPPNLAGSFTLPEALRSVTAQADAADELLRVLGPDSAAAKAILNAQAFSVPRRVVVSEDGK